MWQCDSLLCAKCAFCVRLHNDKFIHSDKCDAAEKGKHSSKHVGVYFAACTLKQGNPKMSSKVDAMSDVERVVASLLFSEKQNNDIC